MTEDMLRLRDGVMLSCWLLCSIRDTMVEVIVKSIKNGPNLIVVDGKTQVAMCRCGHSKSKPLCDGSHHAAKFEAEEKETKIL